MAITVNYSGTPFLITIPKSDLTLDTGTKYNLIVDVFWQLLRDYADSEEGMVHPVIYSRIPATASTPSITEVNIDYYELQFEDGLYSVNIINGNTNIRDVEVKNQVSVNTNNTTGFIDQTILVHGTFNSGIYWDNINGKAAITDISTDGNEANPLLNLTDVISQAVLLRFNKIHVVAAASTVDPLPSLDEYKLDGISRANTLINFGSGSPIVKADTGDSVFTDLHLVGDLWGGISVVHCVVGDLTGVGCTVNETIIDNSLFVGDMILRVSNTQPVTIVNCGAINGHQFVLDVNGTTGNIVLQNFSDRLKIINMTSAIDIHISSAAGCELVIDASCTAAGIFEVHGSVVVINESNLTIDDDTIMTQNDNILAMIIDMFKYEKNRTKIDPVAFTMTIYDDDLTTPIRVFDLKDSNGVASVTEIYERIPQ